MSKAKWQSGVPVFRIREKYVYGRDAAVGVGFDVDEDGDVWIDVLIGDCDGDIDFREQMPPEALTPLNADARAMLAIAKAGAK